MLFFKALRRICMHKIKGTGTISFVKGEVHFVEELRNGELGTHCDNNDVNAKARSLEKMELIKEAANPNDINAIVKELLLARMDNV